jgi:biotin synthase-like enzyme
VTTHTWDERFATCRLVRNYLTTLGPAPQEDLVMLDKLRMPIGTLSKVI